MVTKKNDGENIMKIMKVLGAEKCYLMDNGEHVPFEDIKAYVKQHKLPRADKPKKKGRKKKGELQ